MLLVTIQSCSLSKNVITSKSGAQLWAKTVCDVITARRRPILMMNNGKLLVYTCRLGLILQVRK